MLCSHGPRGGFHSCTAGCHTAQACGYVGCLQTASAVVAGRKGRKLHVRGGWAVLLLLLWWWRWHIAWHHVGTCVVVVMMMVLDTGMCDYCCQVCCTRM